MRPLTLLAAVAAALPLGAYTYDYQDALTSIDNAKWTQNPQSGVLLATPSGLTSSDPYGGSLIYKPASTSGNNYEVALTLRLSASGGNYRAYLRATADASMGSPVTGSFYAVDVYPVLNGNTWGASVSVWKSVSGALTQLAVFGISCHDGSVVRALAKGNFIGISVDNLVITGIPDDSLAAGQPGVGVAATPAGNSVSLFQLWPLDTAPPNPVDLRTVGISSLPNSVELQWQPPSDDGTGTAGYQVTRMDSGDHSINHGPEYVDATVEASTPPNQYKTYQYRIYAFDRHYNYSAPTDVSVTTLWRARWTRDRSAGARWVPIGAQGEQIDVRSGNLNFTLPLLKAQGRGGWGVTFALSYGARRATPAWASSPSTNSTDGRPAG